MTDGRTVQARMSRLADVADIIRGLVPAKPTDTDEGVPFFGIAEITSGGVGPMRFVVPTDVDEKAQYLEEGDVVVALLSSIGESALVTRSHSGAVLGRECAVLRAHQSDVLGAWLYAWTQSASFRQQVQARVSGSTMPRLSPSALAEFLVPIPALSEQERIRNMLEGFDTAISSANTVLANLMELRRVEVDLALSQVAVADDRRSDGASRRSSTRSDSPDDRELPRAATSR
jgi:restriction endonuclease S subunit